MVAIGGVNIGGSAINFSGIQQGALYISIAIPIIVIFAFGLLTALKRRKFIYAQVNLRGRPDHPIMEIHDKSIAKMRRNRMFFDLIEVWWKPSEWEFIDKMGRRIEGASDDDLKDINGHKGFWTRQKGDDPKILAPISQLDIKGDSILANIADADLKEAARHNIEKGEKESANLWTNYGPIIVNITMMVIFIIGLILVIQFAQGVFDKILTVMSQRCTEFLATTGTAASHIPSTAP